MKRFLLLYTVSSTQDRHYAEGLIHVDGSVYVRGFHPEPGKLFADLQALKNHVRDIEDIWYSQIILLDKEPV